MHVEPATYQGPPATATGFYALGGDPRHPGEKRPGVVLIHEWWGLNDQVRGQAQALAKEGFAVLAVDLYGGKHATDPNEAWKLMNACDPVAAVANMRAAVAWLRGRPEVAGDRVACLGWCLGGAMALRLALAQHDLAGCVIYYGVQLETDPARLKGMPPVLGLFGADDDNPAPAYVAEFEDALRAAQVPAKIVVFEEAGHAFANATRDDRYRPAQAQAAWRETLEFLGEMGGVRR